MQHTLLYLPLPDRVLLLRAMVGAACCCANTGLAAAACMGPPETRQCFSISDLLKEDPHQRHDSTQLLVSFDVPGSMYCSVPVRKKL
jgi:hypothetical protein